MLSQFFSIFTVIAIFLGFLPSATGAVTAFVARPPYIVAVNGVDLAVDIGMISRSFNFGGAAPFVNLDTGVSDIATINYWDPILSKGTVINSSKITALGIPQRVFKTGIYTAVGYKAGDGIVEGALRTQLTSFPIPSRKMLIWNFKFRLGGGGFTRKPWVFTPAGVAPATLWQLKAPGLPPAVVMAVDTDVASTGSLRLTFDVRPLSTKAASQIASIGALKPNTDIYVRVEVFTDERSIENGGQGYLRITVNSRVITERFNQILQAEASQPYQWSLAMYLYSNTTPLDFDRFGYWERASMSIVE